MDLRQQKILEAIMEAFIESGNPVGSKYLCEFYDFDVSSATIRNEMAILEREGYIVQPHTSAGRVPTNRAYRMLVDQLKQEQSLTRRVQQDMEAVKKQYFLRQTKEKLYDIVAILAGVTRAISFATVPESDRVFYLGIGNILRKPEFTADPLKATRVVESIEHELFDVLSNMEIREEGNVYIGEENLLPEFQSCSLLAIPYSYKSFDGVMGILGSTRMDYAYNMAALKLATQLL